MAKDAVGDQRWTSWVIECLRDDGSFSRSDVAELLEQHRQRARSGLQKIERFQDIGWPEAREVLKIEHGRRAIVRPDTKEPEVWELKTNPHEWRFYFQIDDQRRFITYAHATYKTKTAANANDLVRARTLIARLNEGTARRRELRIT